MKYNLTPDDLRDAFEMGHDDGPDYVKEELIAFVRKVHAHPAVPASLHDQAARILQWPSLAHGEADNE